MFPLHKTKQRRNCTLNYVVSWITSVCTHAQAGRAAKPIPNLQLMTKEGGSSRIIQVMPFYFNSSFSPYCIFLFTHDISFNGILLSQDDIIKAINKHPNAGWTAARNPYFANYTVNNNTLLLLFSFFFFCGDTFLLLLVLHTSKHLSHACSVASIILLYRLRNSNISLEWSQHRIVC